MKFEVTLDLLEEMADTISNCNWADGEIYDYMKSCVTGSDNYDPDKYESNSDL